MTVAHLQISHADVILLNKIDLVTPSELEAITERIRSINALARLIPTTHSAIPDLSGTVLDLHAYDATQTTLPNFSEKGHSHLDPTISTISFALPPFDPQKLYLLQNWLQSLLWDDGEGEGKRKKRYEVHRLKGYIPITDGTARVVQGVREVFDIIDVEEAAEEGGRQDEGKIVVIGRGLEHIDLGGL
jgi:G3E family GTPase